MPTARSAPFIGAIGARIYVVGGQSNGVAINVNEIYDTTTDTWSAGTPIPTPRWVGASAVVNNILYAIGGQNSSGALDVLEAYDPVANSWSTKAPMPVGIDSMYATAANNIIYVVGGFNPANSRLKTVLSHNPVTNTWANLASLSVGKSQSAVGLVGSTIVSAGGLLASNTATTDNEGYGIATNLWTTLAPLPTARHAGCFAAIGDGLFFAGGHSVASGDPLLTMDEYRADTNAWTSGLAPLLYAVTSPGSASVNGNLYCFGGSGQGNTGLNYVQIYQPPVPPPAITSSGVVPVFSSSTTIEPGSWVSIYGTNLAPSTATWNGNFPTMLGNTSVTIDGEGAYLWYVSPGQINLQAPADLKTGIVAVAVTTPGGTATSTVTLGPFGPSLSLLDGRHIAGIIIRSDGSGAYGNGAYDIIGPTGMSLGYPTVAARAGDTIEIFGVGFGPTNPPVPAGEPYSGAAPATNSVQFLINGTEVLPDFSGITAAGLFQFNIDHLPANLGTGDVSIQGAVADVQSPTGAVISLQ